MNIETRLSNLENLVYSFIKSQNKINDNKKEDINGCVNTSFEQKTDIEINATDISDNRDGLMETFETSLVNTDDISSLREGLEEVYEMLLESEV